MAGVHLKVSFNDRLIVDHLQRLIDKGENPRPVFLEIGEYLLESTEQRFSDQVDPDGNPWAALNPKYRQRKKKHQDLILVLDQHLSGTLRYRAGSKHLAFGTDRIYGAAHQFGYPEGNLPARPWLGLSAADEVEILDILRSYLS